MMTDVAYCWVCKEFSFVHREDLHNSNAECQHCREMTHLADIGEVQYELRCLAEHSGNEGSLDRLIELARKTQTMGELNKTPMDERKVGRAVLLTYWELEDVSAEEIRNLKGRKFGGISRGGNPCSS